MKMKGNCKKTCAKSNIFACGALEALQTILNYKFLDVSEKSSIEVLKILAWAQTKIKTLLGTGTV